MIGDDTSRPRIRDMMGKKEFEITYRSKQMQGKFSATLETFALLLLPGLRLAIVPAGKSKAGQEKGKMGVAWKNNNPPPANEIITTKQGKSTHLKPDGLSQHCPCSPALSHRISRASRLTFF